MWNQMAGSAVSAAPLSPSAKLVYKILEWNGPMKRQSIKEESTLSESTLTTALNQLDDHGITETQPNPHHSQRPYYTLAADE